MAKRNLNLEREWRLKYEAYKSSELSIRKWCKKNQIKASAFHYWIKKFKESEEIESLESLQFAKIELKPTSDNNEISRMSYESGKNNISGQQLMQPPDFQIFFRSNNIQLTVPDNFNPTSLAGLIKILQVS